MFARTHFLLLSSILLVIGAACSGDDDDGASAAGDGGLAGNGGGKQSATDGGVDDGGDPEADAGEIEPFCGDGILQEDLFEVCDDKNFFDNDGCTSLCELTCEDDEDCVDTNLCDGVKFCNDDNFCEPGKYAEDGEPCDKDMSCFAGLCIFDVCGDKRINESLGEDCDDGNAVDDDGCTTKCEFTCSSDDDCKSNEVCSGATICDTDEHICGGDPLPDKTTCTMKDQKIGWCFNEVCVPADCGDEEVGGKEQCDLGNKNGVPGSGCSVDCRTVVCGNGKLEGDEQCDDGNDLDLDGCDSNCKAEILFRFTRLDVLSDPAPEWCVHAGKNQFGSAFPGRVPILGLFEIDVLNDIINTGMNQTFMDCSSNMILQVRDLEGGDFTRSDDEVRLSSYTGVLGPDAVCNDPMNVDTEFYITGENIDDDNQPKSAIRMIQRPGIVKTEAPMEMAAPEGSGDSRISAMKDFMMLLPIDTTRVSTPPGMADWVELPEEYGFNEPGASPYHPAGIVCAAMDTSGFSSSPISSDSAQGGGSCCKASGGGYRSCEEGDVLGTDCDTLLDMFIGGCTICLDATMTMNCDDCLYSFEVIRPTAPDVDTDDDGKADAYSIVVGLEGMRISSLGVQR